MKKSLDSRRGRKPRTSYQSLLLSTRHYDSIFRTPGLWDRLWSLLRRAKTEQEVTDAFETVRVPDIHYFVPNLSGLILRVIRDPKFPKGTSAQIRFFVDSIAGHGRVAPRRSIDIAQKERAKAEQAHQIIRSELYVVCSCGYEGPSLHGKCAECGAPIVFLPF